MKTRRFALGALAALACTASVLAGAPAEAQTYPDKPIRLIVPFTPGGVTDNIGRVLAERMGRELGQSIIIDNRAGANGRIGTDAVAKAAPDGYTLLLGGIGALTIHPHMLKVPYDPVNDFVPISLVATNDVVIVVNPKLPVKTPAELVAYAKANGNKMQYGSSGIGAPTHLAAELFKTRVGSTMVHVPYKGGGPAMADLLGAQVDATFMNINTGLPNIKAGKLRALAITSAKRSPLLPDVPTMEELGIKGVTVYSWQAFAAPKGLPADIKAKLHQALVAGLNDPAVKPKLLDLGFEIVGNTPEQFTAFQASEFARWKKVIEVGKITAD